MSFILSTCKIKGVLSLAYEHTATKIPLVRIEGQNPMFEVDQGARVCRVVSRHVKKEFMRSDGGNWNRLLFVVRDERLRAASPFDWSRAH
jgi:hypothetical protein